jgi:hypothetical protein
MMAQWITKLKRREANPRGRPKAFTLIELLVAIATVVLVTGIPAWAVGPDEPNSLAQVLAAVRECMAKSPAPWPQVWQQEYVETIRQVAVAHQDSPGYAARLEILRKGFAPYWEAVPKNDQRSLFEVRRAAIRWYVENLMVGELPSDNSKKKLREHYKGLVDYARDALLTQFPFLDPNRVRLAQADHLRKCDRIIKSPLLPTLWSPFTKAQVDQLKERWTKLRYARVDLWRQLGGGAASTAKPAQVPSGNTHPDYLLTERSLDQLRGQIWSLIPAPPNYYRNAVSKDMAAQKQRAQSQANARAQEARLGVADWQTEYLSFLVTALLETADFSADGAPKWEEE